MSNFDFSILDFNKNDFKKSKFKNIENKRNIDSYTINYRNDIYTIGNLKNLGINNSIANDLLNTTKIKKIAKGWQLTLIDWFAVQDFIRAYKCTKTQLATYSLRYYIPYNIYDLATLNIINLYYPENTYALSEILLNEDKAFPTLDEYNLINAKSQALVNSKYTDTLKGFSWDFYQVDALAAQIFSDWSATNYNDIIQNSLRSFIQPSNYKNAEEILDLLNKQDNERRY